jgi:hypothetical protein
MKSQNILVLNKFYFPVGVETVERTFSNIFSGSVFPLDIVYETNDEGNVNFNAVESFIAVRSVDEWINIGIRPYDDFIQTTKGPVRIPQVVICSRFDKIVFCKVQFPTKSNILKRDNYTCVYTGKKLSKDQVSIDHILPRSRGGRDTWENLVCCDREINIWKGDRTPSECKLKLRYAPFKPKNGLIFETYRDEWVTFLGKS